MGRAIDGNRYQKTAHQHQALLQSALTLGGFEITRSLFALDRLVLRIFIESTGWQVLLQGGFLWKNLILAARAPEANGRQISRLATAQSLLGLQSLGHF